MTGRWALAPWVIRSHDGRRWLGPKLGIVEFDARVDGPSCLDDEGRERLADEGFLIDEGASPRVEDEGHWAGEGVGGAEPRTLPAGADAFVVCGPWRPEGEALVAALGRLDARRAWVAVARREELVGATRGAPLVLLAATEPLDVAASVGGLLGTWSVVWFGETDEGPHAGPLLRTASDVDRYARATSTWASSGRLRDLGFDERWPLSLVREIRGDVDRVAHAVVGVLDDERRGGCRLVATNRPVTLWTSLELGAVSSAELIDTQAWAKGLLRGLCVTRSGDCPGVYEGSCATPCEGVDYLEANAGKGLSVEKALRTTVGEAVERFAAWRANTRPAPAARATRSFRLRDFHPCGPAWGDYVRAGEPALATRSVESLLTGEPVNVPACLVPFPYVAGAESKATTSVATGLAAHDDRTRAITHGLLETLERNNFYRAFLHLRRGVRVAPGRLGLGDRLGPSVAEREAWFVHYEDDFASPVVHAFVHERGAGFLSRGSGSGATLAAAAEGAFAEAMQLRYQFDLLLREAGAAHEPWAAPYLRWSEGAVVAEIIDYLRALPEVADVRWPVDNGSPLLERLVLRLARQGFEALVADLPCPASDWATVRVLVPGLSTHQEASSSAGGRPLLDAPFRYGVPV